MRLYRFDAKAGKKNDRFGSQELTFCPIARVERNVHVGYLQLGPGGRVGFHQAAGPQLFLVVQGQGWVRGETPEHLPIHPGEAVFWEDGEWHEAGTVDGMATLVVEADDLDPSLWVPIDR